MIDLSDLAILGLSSFFGIAAILGVLCYFIVHEIHKSRDSILEKIHPTEGSQQKP